MPVAAGTFNVIDLRWDEPKRGRRMLRFFGNSGQT